MARLYVGQRVRLVRPDDPKFMGCEGRISFVGDTFRAYQREGQFAGHGDCIVDWDDGDWSPQDLWQLEPIQDPGHQVISWEEMADLWTPERIEA